MLLPGGLARLPVDAGLRFSACCGIPCRDTGRFPRLPGCDEEMYRGEGGRSLPDYYLNRNISPCRGRMGQSIAYGSSHGQTVTNAAAMQGGYSAARKAGRVISAGTASLRRI